MVSADYLEVFKQTCGMSLGDGYIGVCGVLSSVLIIGDAAVKAWLK